MLIALVPALASLSFSHTVLFLMLGTLFYAWAESMRYLGFYPPIISKVTAAVLRKREEGRFALAPVTLGLGSLLALTLFPPQAAAAAIFVLAFGDSVSTLIGKFFGRLRPSFLSGKSVEGSLACFTVSGLIFFLAFHEWRMAIAAATVSTVAEALPFRDFDNLILPLAAGLCGTLYLNFTL